MKKRIPLIFMCAAVLLSMVAPALASDNSEKSISSYRYIEKVYGFGGVDLDGEVPDEDDDDEEPAEPSEPDKPDKPEEPSNPTPPSGGNNGGSSGGNNNSGSNDRDDDDDDDDDDDSSSRRPGSSSSSNQLEKNPSTSTDNTTTKTETETEKPNVSYYDVPVTEWYYNAVVYVSQKGMMSGNNGNFSPNSPINRARMAQIQ